AHHDEARPRRRRHHQAPRDHAHATARSPRRRLRQASGGHRRARRLIMTQAPPQHDKHDKHDKKDVRAFNAAVITMSDTRTGTDDPSGDLVAELLVAAGHTVQHRSHVKDDPKAIKLAFDWLLAEGVDLIITTG